MSDAIRFTRNLAIFVGPEYVGEIEHTGHPPTGLWRVWFNKGSGYRAPDPNAFDRLSQAKDAARMVLAR